MKTHLQHWQNGTILELARKTNEQNCSDSAIHLSRKKKNCWANTSTFSQKVTGEPCCTLPRVSGVNRLYTPSNMGERAKSVWIAANSTRGAHTHPVRHKRPKAAVLKYKADACLFFCYTMTRVLVLVTQVSSFISFCHTVKKSSQASQGQKPLWNPERMDSVVMMIALKENYDLLKKKRLILKTPTVCIGLQNCSMPWAQLKGKKRKRKRVQSQHIPVVFGLSNSARM